MDWAFEPIENICDFVCVDLPCNPTACSQTEPWKRKKSKKRVECTEDGDEYIEDNGKRCRSFTTLTADMLCSKQEDVARQLGFKVSTFSKRWKEAVPDRKWPFRALCKIDKELATMLTSGNLPELERLHKERARELVVVRVRK